MPHRARRFDALIPQATDAADRAAQAQGALVAAQITQAGDIGLAAAVFVVLVLVGSAVFGRLSITSPLRKMAGILGEFTNDRIVEVPYTNRADEIGEIAKATEVFKD
jgi:methyl-accepting chemotaxis protein